MTIDTTLTPVTTATSTATATGSWNEPGGIAARGTLVVLGGRGETPAVYERFGTRLSRDAYRVRALGDATADTEAVRAEVLALLDDPDTARPVVLVGSDAGAALALELAATASGPEPLQVDAVILAGLPTAGSGAVSGDAVEARTACPNHQKVLRRETTADDLDRTLPPELLAITASAVTLPVLALHGEADTISPLGAAREVYEQLASVELITVVGGRHDVLNDVSHRSVAASVVLFLERLKVNGDVAVPIVRGVHLRGDGVRGATLDGTPA